MSIRTAFGRIGRTGAAGGFDSQNGTTMQQLEALDA